MEIAFLASGSSGNCAVVRAGKSAVLLDAGLSVRQTKLRLAELGVRPDDVRALFVTHEHSDHVRSAIDLARAWELPVYATCGTGSAAGFPGPLLLDWRPVRDGAEVTLGDGDLTVRTTGTPHDGAESVCYTFADSRGRRAGVVTDVGHLSERVLAALEDCDVLGLEANHDVELLRTGPYPAFLKRRILSDVGHLSNDAAAAGLPRLLGPRTKRVVLLHLSQHNNTAALATRAVADALAALGADAPLAAARPDAATPWYAA